MSLEQAITDHASALRELAAAIRAKVGAHDTTAAAAEKVISDAKKPTAAKTDVAGPKQQTTVATAPTETKQAEQQAPTYDDVKAKVLTLSKDKGRDQVVAILQRYGVAKAPDLKPEQYADIIADIDAIIAGTYDPEAAETV